MNDFDILLNQARSWAKRAQEARWLNDNDSQLLDAIETDTPSSLFDASSHRPLVTAFFGGTGAGKSSLLNRLAEQAIARTGVERPTSREVSIYLHDSVQLERLPADFPVERVRVARHGNEASRHIMWIDMPDIDSVEQENRNLVCGWLPHIDVVIYVVSPERYRDDSGWRLLCEQGGDHAWLFVMNQWDRACPEQFAAFETLLVATGFSDPVLLRTDCREPGEARQHDDFSRLQAVLNDISAQHVLRQLESHASRQRLASLQATLIRLLERMGGEERYTNLQHDWQGIWTQTRSALMTGLEWPIQSVTANFTGIESNPLARSVDLTASPTDSSSTRPKPVLWDDWAEGCLSDALNQMVVEAGNRGLPAPPLKSMLEPLARNTGKAVLASGQLGLRQALANPGNAMQRFALRLSGLLTVLLPLSALGWASYRVVMGYYESATLHSASLGVDFAIHSLLLIALAWLMPWFVYTRLKPSLERTASRGLRSGIAEALDITGEAVLKVLNQIDIERQSVIQEGRKLLDQARTEGTPAPPISGLLERVLMKRTKTAG